MAFPLGKKAPGKQYGYRHIDGQLFELYDEYLCEKDAMDDIAEHRRQGIPCRLVPRKGRGIMKYALYVPEYSSSLGIQ